MRRKHANYFPLKFYLDNKTMKELRCLKGVLYRFHDPVFTSSCLYTTEYNTYENNSISIFRFNFFQEKCLSVENRMSKAKGYLFKYVNTEKTVLVLLVISIILAIISFVPKFNT